MREHDRSGLSSGSDESEKEVESRKQDFGESSSVVNGDDGNGKRRNSSEAKLPQNINLPEEKIPIIRSARVSTFPF